MNTQHQQMYPQRWAKVNILWNTSNKGVPIIQPAVQQQHQDSCAITALTTHIEYNLRITYAYHVEGGAIELPRGPLVKLDVWDRQIKTIYDEHRRKQIPELLEEAKQNGVPLWNNLTLKIDSGNHFHWESPERPSVQSMLERIKYFTLLGVMKICEDYSPNGERPYMAREAPIKNSHTGLQEFHAVVIVGVYVDDSLFGQNEQVEPLWIYQNSDGDKDASFLGNGMNVARHSVFVEGFCAETFATNELLSDVMAQLVTNVRPPYPVAPPSP